MAQQIAGLDEDERSALIDGLSEEEAEQLLYDWPFWARPEQLTPPGNWRIWLLLTGRGWGKTRCGAEDVKRFGLDHPGSRIAIVAPTYADARDTCVEGDSGLLRCLRPADVATWNRSLGELVLTNSTRYKLFSADEPDRLRGPQNHRAWCDELAAWTYAREAFDMLMLGLRLGDNPRVVITTTPKPIELLRDLVKRAGTVGSDVVLTKGSTFENRDHLAPAFLDQIVERYRGTRLARQELFADILDDVPGALWARKRIDDLRLPAVPDGVRLVRVVVAVDPSVTDAEGSAETGIVVAGLGSDRKGYVLADHSLRASPATWAAWAVWAYHYYRADRIVAEANNGGDLVETTIRLAGQKDYPPPEYPAPAYKKVHASRGKQTRAEPIAALYEQGRVHHVGTFDLLEDQLCSWVPGMPSPDRLDALVWAISELMLGYVPGAAVAGGHRPAYGVAGGR